MKKILLLIVLFALGGCVAGEFKDRDRVYGKDAIGSICDDEPALCEDPNNADW